MSREKLTEREANSYSPLTLAFLGDSVYDTLVREYLLRKANMPVAKLHSAKIRLVCAEFQSKAYDLVAEQLSEHELAVLKRGRNATGNTVPKHADAAEYRRYRDIQKELKQLTMDEVELVKKWVVTWKLTQEQVLEACAETTKASKPSFAYLDAVLKNRMDGDDALWEDLTEVLRELDAGQATPTPDQRKKYAELLSEGFEPECVKLAAIQCHRRKKTRFEDVEWMLRRWGAEGIRTRAAAEAYIEAMQAKAARVREVLELCGLERRPTMGDLTMYENWQAVHDPALIDYAATCARGMQVPMKYMDKLLEDWKAGSVRTVEEAAARHAAARQARAASAPAQNPALNYAQREYKEEDYGDDFFVDLDKYADDSTGGGDVK